MPRPAPPRTAAASSNEPPRTAAASSNGPSRVGAAHGNKSARAATVPARSSLMRHRSAAEGGHHRLPGRLLERTERRDEREIAKRTQQAFDFIGKAFVMMPQSAWSGAWNVFYRRRREGLAAGARHAA